MREGLQNLAMAIVDLVMAVVPRRLPDESVLRNCKIISHRGEHDNRTVLENTLTAFANARAAGVWGIECDIRFTADDVPVICHDPDTRRVFGRELVVAEMDFTSLRKALPEIPTLAEVVTQFGGQAHLMLELKSLERDRLPQHQEALRRELATLEPVRDYHILSLQEDLFPLADFAGPEAMLPVAQTNTRAFSELALERGYSGLAGHYLMVNSALQARHQAAGQRVGTGFPRSRRCLYRELNRGVDWIFTNDAVYLQSLLPPAVGD